MTVFKTWDKNDTQKIGELGQRYCPIAVADPGASGVVLGWDRGLRGWPRPPDWRRSVGSNGSGHRHVALRCGESDVQIFIIEDQFIGRGKGARSMISLVRSAGSLVGHVQMHSPPDEVIWIPPSAWQKRLPKGPDTKERSRIHAARLLGEAWLAGQGHSPLQEACADVVGIMAFYEEITRHETSETNLDLGF